MSQRFAGPCGPPGRRHTCSEMTRTPSLARTPRSARPTCSSIAALCAPAPPRHTSPCPPPAAAAGAGHSLHSLNACSHACWQSPADIEALVVDEDMPELDRFMLLFERGQTVQRLAVMNNLPATVANHGALRSHAPRARRMRAHARSGAVRGLLAAHHRRLLPAPRDIATHCRPCTDPIRSSLLVLSRRPGRMQAAALDARPGSSGDHPRGSDGRAGRAAGDWRRAGARRASRRRLPAPLGHTRGRGADDGPRGARGGATRDGRRERDECRVAACAALAAADGAPARAHARAPRAPVGARSRRGLRARVPPLLYPCWARWRTPTPTRRGLAASSSSRR